MPPKVRTSANRLCIFHHGALPSVRKACENIGIQWKNACQLSVPKASHDAKAIATSVTLAAVKNTRPLRRRDQHQRKQQAVLRLVAEQPEANAGKDRPDRHQIKRAADQRRGEKAVLADQHIVERHRHRQREQQAERTPDDRAHHGEIRHEADQRPADERHGVGKMRQQGGDEQEGRRVMPGEIAGEIPAEQRNLDLLLNIPVPSLRGLAIERQPARGPDVDEIGRDAQSG